MLGIQLARECLQPPYVEIRARPNRAIKAFVPWSLCPSSARFYSPRTAARAVNKHEPVRRDKPHAPRVFKITLPLLVWLACRALEIAGPPQFTLRRKDHDDPSILRSRGLLSLHRLRSAPPCPGAIRRPAGRRGRSLAGL